MEIVFKELARVKANGEKAALSTIISSKGSTPMSPKSKMLVKTDGTLIGTIGGGCLEANVWAASQEVIREGGPKVSSFRLTEKDAGESGLICGGAVSVFTEPVLPGVMDEIFAAMAEIVERGSRASLATVVGDIEEGLKWGNSMKILIKENGSVVGKIINDRVTEKVAEEARRVLSDDVPRMLKIVLEPDERSYLGLKEDAQGRIFIESLLPRPTMFIFGAGHISLHLSKIGKIVGFKVVVIDDRPAFANAERFPEADEIVVEDFTRVFEKLDINESSYLISVTRGHLNDMDVIEQAAKIKPKYIGLIGSRAKIKTLYGKLMDKGISEDFLKTIHAPIGLNIGADTPEEIAVSIVAELIQLRRANSRRLNF